MLRAATSCACGQEGATGERRPGHQGLGEKKGKEEGDSPRPQREQTNPNLTPQSLTPCHVVDAHSLLRAAALPPTAVMQ